MARRQNEIVKFHDNVFVYVSAGGFGEFALVLLGLVFHTEDLQTYQKKTDTTDGQYTIMWRNKEREPRPRMLA